MKHSAIVFTYGRGSFGCVGHTRGAPCSIKYLMMTSTRYDGGLLELLGQTIAPRRIRRILAAVNAMAGK
eukprot:3785955-Rhodomonas_salina.3